MKEIVKIPKDKGDQYKAILVMVIGFLIISLFLEKSRPQLAEILKLVSIGIGFLSLVSTWIMDKVIWLWFGLAMVLGFVMSRILLGGVFYLFLFPIAKLASLNGKDALKLKQPKDSNFAIRDHEYKAEDLQNIW